LKAVLFDLGDTLIKTASVPEIFKRILAAHGIERPLQQIASAFREVDGQLSLEDYSLPYREFWRLYNVKILKRLGIHENLEALADTITDEWWCNADVKLYPDVKETLRMLKKKGLKTGIVTNGFQTDIKKILSMTRLTGVFDVTVGVDAVGKPKPNKEIFLYALEKMKIPPREALFVGDNLKTDYEGAESSGLKPILIDRNGEIKGKIRKIQDLREIVRYL